MDFSSVASAAAWGPCSPLLDFNIQMSVGCSVQRQIPKYVPAVVDMTMYALKADAYRNDRANVNRQAT